MEDNRKRCRKEKRAEAVTEYRSLTRKVQNLRRNDDVPEVLNTINECLERCDELYPIVKKKLDGTAADSRHIKEVLNLCKETSKRINVSSSRHCEIGRLIKDLMLDADDRAEKKLNKFEFNRFVIEKNVGTFSCNPPTFQFMYGAIKCEDLVKKERKKKIKEKIVASEAVRAKEKDVKIDVVEDTTPKEVELIQKRINRLGSGKPFFNLVTDPNSFIKTVENIFHISFLFKEGQFGALAINPDEPKLPVLTIHDSGTSKGQKREHEAAGKQSILSFSMKDHETWKRAFNIKAV